MTRPRIDAARGTRIKAARKKRGLTQARLAEVLGVDERTVKRWERGGGISSESAEALEAELDVRVYEKTTASPGRLDEINRKLDELRGVLLPQEVRDNAEAVGAPPNVANALADLQQVFVDAQGLIAEIRAMMATPDSARFRTPEQAPRLRAVHVPSAPPEQRKPS